MLEVNSMPHECGAVKREWVELWPKVTMFSPGNLPISSSITYQTRDATMCRKVDIESEREDAEASKMVALVVKTARRLVELEV